MDIKFISKDLESESCVDRPVQARNAIPEWFKKIPRSIENVGTSKICMPFFDTITSCYIQNNGLYYEMLLDTINSSIEIQNNSYTPLSFLNRDISMRQSSNTQTSPAYVSRCVSDTIFSNSYLSDDENNE
jgi:hypothetical protein